MKKTFLKWKKPKLDTDDYIYYDLVDVLTNKPIAYIECRHDVNQYICCAKDYQIHSLRSVPIHKTFDEAKTELIKIVEMYGYKVINEDLEVYV
jgi:hypothetical protein